MPCSRRPSRLKAGWDSDMNCHLQGKPTRADMIRESLGFCHQGFSHPSPSTSTYG